MSDKVPCDADEDDDSDSPVDVAELERYRSRLNGTMIAGDIAWWEMDIQTGGVQFHENKAHMLGYEPERFNHYEDFTKLVHPDDHEPTMQAMRDALDGSVTKYDAEYRIRESSGEFRWFHDVGGVTERATDGSPRTVSGIVVDITSRKEVESKLRQQSQQLAVLNQIVHHDIRNDVAIIGGWLELLRQDLPAGYEDHLQRIERANEHISELTETVRAVVTSLEDAEGGIDLQPVDLREILDDTIERIESRDEQVDIALVGDPDVSVRANTMLSSVFYNLLNNAVQHNDAETTEITIDVVPTDVSVEIRVIDNGPGIPSEVRDTLFDPDVKGLESSGTGLGLYLVQTLVEKYGGYVRVSDNVPKGTVFVVELVRV